MRLYYFLKQQKITLCVFLFPEQCIRHLPCSVINGPYQAELWSIFPNPMVGTPIDLEKHAFLRVALSALSVFAWPSFPRTMYPDRL